MKLKNVLYLLPLVAILALIWATHIRAADPGETTSDVDYYTCAMHPMVRSQDPDGHCPICGMHLIPFFKPAANSGTNAGATNDTPTEFTIPMSRQQFIGVTYATIEKKPLRTTLRSA